MQKRLSSQKSKVVNSLNGPTTSLACATRQSRATINPNPPTRCGVQRPATCDYYHYHHHLLLLLLLLLAAAPQSGVPVCWCIINCVAVPRPTCVCLCGRSRTARAALYIYIRRYLPPRERQPQLTPGNAKAGKLLMFLRTRHVSGSPKSAAAATAAMVPDRDADGITVMAHDNQVRSSAAAAAAAAAAVAAAAAPLPSSLLEDGVRFENNNGSSSSGSSSSNNRNNRGGGGGGGGGRGEEAEELLQPQKQQQHWQQQASFRHVSSSPMPLTPPLRRRRPESTKGKRRRQQPETKDGEGRTPLTRKGVLLWTCYASGLLMACVFLFAWLRTIAMAKVVFSEGRSGTGGIVVDAGFGETDSWAAAAAAGRSPSFTVLVNTFQRPKQLAEAVRHYAACEG